MGLLIDSTWLVEAERRSFGPSDLIGDILELRGDIALALSAMSAGELLHGCWRADTATRRARRVEYVEALLAAVPVLPIDLPIMRVFAEIDASLRADGARLPTSDLLIGCTALVHGLDVLSGNRRHFDRIPGLVVLDTL